MNEQLRRRATEYLGLRRAMGYQPCDQPWLIREFLGYLDQQEVEVITVMHALSWASVSPTSSPRWRNQRLAVIRLLAAHIHAGDPELAELIPRGLLPARVVRAVPYLYSPAQICALICQAQCLRPVVRGQTLAAVIALMAATGMRTGEAVALNLASLDTEHATILVRGKGDNERLLPMHATTIAALMKYVETSRQWVDSPLDGALFVNANAARPLANSIQTAFRITATECGLPSPPGCRKPRLHDLRHTFAVNTLIDAHRSGVGVQARIAELSTYLGHGSPAHTYWYLTASPELLQLVNDRIENHRQGDLP